MSALTFDTLHYAKALKESGLSEAAAEKQTAALASVIHTIEKEVLLKSDQTISTTQQDSKLDKAVLILENKIDSEIKKIELLTKTEIAIVKGELTLIKWMLGVVMAGILSLVLKQFS